MALLLAWFQTSSPWKHRSRNVSFWSKLLCLQYFVATAMAVRHKDHTCIKPEPKAYLLGVVEGFFYLRYDGTDVITLINTWKQSTPWAIGEGVALGPCQHLHTGRPCGSDTPTGRDGTVVDWPHQPQPRIIRWYVVTKSVTDHGTQCPGPRRKGKLCSKVFATLRKEK